MHICAHVSAGVCFSIKVAGGRRGPPEVWRREGRKQVLSQATRASGPGSELELP